MKIHFVTEGSLNGFWDKTEGIDCDVIVFGFNGLENVYYERELDGETGKLEDLAGIKPQVAVAGLVPGGFVGAAGREIIDAAFFEQRLESRGGKMQHKGDGIHL